MEKLIEIDMKLFTLLNGWHSDFFDPIMVSLSKVWVWVPLYIGVLIYLFFTKKWKVALLAVATTRLTSSQLKAYGNDSSAYRRFPGIEPARIGLHAPVLAA